MSEPKRVVEESLRAVFIRMKIPLQLGPFWNEKLPCGCSCSGCRGTRPGCKTGEREQNRKFLNEFVERQNDLLSVSLKNNVSTLHAFWRVGNRYCNSIGMHMDPSFMSNFQKTLVDTALRQSRLQRYINDICLTPDVIQRYVDMIFYDCKLSRAQVKVICPWIDDEFPLVPIGAMKKILMTCIALSFLIKRLVSNGGDRGEKKTGALYVSFSL